MRKKLRIFSLFLAAVLLSGGCGTPMYELTDEEQDLIIQYSANVVGMHNIFQKDGMKKIAEETEDSASSQNSETPATETESETEEKTPQGGDSAPGNNSSGKALSLAEAIGHDGDLSVRYDGYKVMKSYKVETYFSVDADQGNELVVMNFTIKNKGSRAVNLNLPAENIVFYGCFDGKNQIPENAAFGLNRPSYYEGKIKAGKSKKTMLIFQIPEEQADGITEESLFVKLKDTIYSVKL